MNAYELFACGHYLSEFPVTASFDEVCDMLVEDSNDILVHDPFYNYDRVEIEDEMKRMRDELVRLFIAKEF